MVCTQLSRSLVLLGMFFNNAKLASALLKTTTVVRRHMVAALSSRIPANDVSLDTNLLSTNPDLVLSHLTSRRSSTELMENVSKLSVLRNERNAQIVAGDAAKNVRKTLSQQIGQLMKEGRTVEVDELKLQVEKANEISATADVALNHIDQQINTIFSVLPNLLDDR